MASDNKAFRDEIARLIAQNNKLGDIVQGMRGEFKEVWADHAEREAWWEAEMARLEAENRELKEMIFGSGLPGEDGGSSTSLAGRLADGSASPEDMRRASGVIRGYAAKEQLKSAGGMELFSVLLSCLETWKRQKTSIEEGMASVIIG